MEASKPLITVQQAISQPSPAISPRYDRVNLGCGIVHIGLGNFHRAHQALFINNYLQNHAENWMIHAVGCLESDRPLIEAMHSQDNLYTLTERSGTEDTIKVVGSIKKISHAPADPTGLIDLLASDEIKIVSLTITEKGYYYTSTGELELDHPVIRADLARDALPKSALGYLFAAARQRRLNQGQPFTIMSCDNLMSNGHLTSRLLLQFAELKEPETARWIRDNIAFPNSMVDRITPATTPKTSAFVRDTFGIDDRCPVMSEAYLQWVLEDNFINGRPELEAVGVQLTNDVEPYEKLKVRLLNGAHSALAYLSYLMGYREVDAAMNDSLIYRFVQKYMDEDITPTLPDVPGMDVEVYKQTLRERFSNPAISDQVQRLALDGSSKLPNSIVPPLEHQLAAGGSIKWIAFALAGWYRYLEGVDESGAVIEVSDPMSETLVALAKGHPNDPNQLLAAENIFGKHLAANTRLMVAVKEALDAIHSLGTRQALTKLLTE